MDLSSDYIRMCNKAKEIQENWIVRDGDYFQCFDEGGKSFTDITAVHPHGGCFGTEYRKESDDGESFWSFDGGYEWDDEMVCLKKDAVWLPRQDQLQEMIVIDSLPIFGVKKGKEDAILGIMRKNTLDGFGIWLDAVVKVDHSFCYKHNSMEQFWLLYVMQEKYNKTWTGRDWIKP